GFSQGKFRILEEAGVEVAVQDKNARHLMLLNGATGKETSKETPDRMPLEMLLKEIEESMVHSR
ncbi:MAG: hypothetical protein HYS08_10670, partial [Chlamydiae bacterium]|nr:hypothetical protein [Chlamydiota bacterium]